MLNQGIKEINQLNKEFYEIHNESFDKSRKDNYWEGFLNTLKYLNNESKVLDLGCGNARFLNFLLENKLKPNYLGVDNSEEFINRNLAKHAPGFSSVVVV
jgi:SAM-dependent methyltransferase